MVTFDNLAYNRLGLESVLANGGALNFEIVVVDNGSSDGTRDYLGKLAEHRPEVRVISNERNLGFAPAVNQGLTAATGDLLVLLNNDTLVPPGWLARLLRHLDNAMVGMVGPVTNRAGNEAEIDVSYKTYGELLQFAGNQTRSHHGRIFDIPTLTMFCAAMRRSVYGKVGPLDESFKVGMFEDDDYSLRMRAAGYRVVCAEDVFVHHFGQASLGMLAGAGQYGELFRANRSRFEAKWGVSWSPHTRRPGQPYLQLKNRIREVAEMAIPPGATVLAVSKGDEDLLNLEGRRVWHFPQESDGSYAGYYPADSQEAIAHLEALCDKGAHFLLFPHTALWWLDHYVEFRKHLESRHRIVPCPEQTCVIFALGRREVGNLEEEWRPHSKRAESRQTKSCSDHPSPAKKTGGLTP